jgi:heavy metal sensor kinase
MSSGLSIRARLTIWYTVVLAAGLALFSFLVWFALGRILRVDIADNLAHKARGFEEYLHIEERDPDVNLVNEIAEYSQSWLEDHLLVIYDGTGALIYSNIGTDLSKTSPHKFRDVGGVRAIHWKHRPYLALSRSITLSRGKFRAFLAVSMQSDERALRALGWLLACAVPVFIACAAGGGSWLSGKAFKPVDRITERARHIGIGNLSERLVVPNTNDELQRLTETWNGMLERLEASVQKISQFTADASHELRTPLAITRLAAENALRKSRTEEEYRSALQHIRRESEKMTDLITDLLFLARADVSTENERHNVNLAELIRDVGSDFTTLALTKEVTLRQDLADMPIAVYGSAASLRRLIVILLDNAIKYTPKGGSVVVRLERRNSEALIEVEDTGVGIPEELKSRVFERFFRADPSRNKESGGYGLGLAIARAIVQQHNAKIETRANSPEGSVFSVILPVT